MSTVAARLAKAAEDASSKKLHSHPQELDLMKSHPARETDSREVDDLSSINQLSQTIDEELLRPRDG